MRLKDKVCIVTGAGAGIGRAIATEMAREGARVAVADIRPDAAEETVGAILKEGGTGAVFMVDVADPSSVLDLAEQTQRRFGDACVLVNNAAIQISKLVEDTTFEEWQRQMSVNVGGVFLCSKHYLPQLRRTRGAVINLSSVNGYFVEPMCAGYCATKGAILAFTKALAIDHGWEGIRVNCICPGYIDTGLAEAYFQAQADPQAARAAAGRLHALGRVGRPEEVARAAVFLASEDASFMTGSALVVDGGFGAGLPPSH